MKLGGAPRRLDRAAIAVEPARAAPAGEAARRQHTARENVDPDAGERRKKLGLVDTLNEMVDGATFVPPGPLFQFLTWRDNGTLDAQQKDALPSLE